MWQSLDVQYLFDRAHVTVTDLPEFVPLMDYNIRHNAASLTGTVSAASLIWGLPAGHGIPTTPDLVLLADCIYYEEVHTNLPHISHQCLWMCVCVCVYLISFLHSCIIWNSVFCHFICYCPIRIKISAFPALSYCYVISLLNNYRLLKKKKKNYMSFTNRHITDATRIATHTSAAIGDDAAQPELSRPWIPQSFQTEGFFSYCFFVTIPVFVTLIL